MVDDADVEAFHDALYAAVHRCAARTGDSRSAAVVRSFCGPVRVAVTGREGVGRRTLAAALAGAGVMVVDGSGGAGADVRVLAVGEALRPEDRAVLRSGGAPTVVVLTKSDLTGAGADGPWAAARRTAALLAADVRLPVVPVVALLALVRLTDDDLAALRALVARPPDLTSVDALVTGPHPVPAPVRAALLDMLDRFGLAHALTWVGDDESAAVLTDRLRGLSGVAAVVRQLHRAAAPVRYRRLAAVQQTAAVLAARHGDDALHAVLTSDEAVLARTAAALEVFEATGAPASGDEEARSPRRRALAWQRRTVQPWDALHRSCAADVVRGYLRLAGRVP